MFNLFENNILFVKRRELPKEGKSENLFLFAATHFDGRIVWQK
jgi:hypothetical protein